MTELLIFFIIIPLAGYIFSIFLPERNEGLISWTAFFSVGLHLLCFLAFFIFWAINWFPTVNLNDIILFQTTDFEFYIDFIFDKITAVYLFVGSFLTFLVTIYSRYYLHRENGYKRFFNTILFFYLGYTIVVLSGNLETLFIGWEILGLSSFLLIAFYRDRYLPVKNAVKVYSIYRIGDIGLLLAMWMSHHLWHENISFLKLNNYELVHSQLQNHSWIGIFVSLMILISAAAKSAQLPFSSWLPRAMEGPTPSSAIFYGALSVHLGVFLLLRTYSFWEHQLSVRIFIGILGLCTSIIASGIASVQSSVKSQIAYSSISQIGLIFIEVAAGFEVLSLIHFAGNAFLRTYQLLVSPSVVTYLIREQFYNFIPRHLKKPSIKDLIPKKLNYTIYMLSLKEWNLGLFLYHVYWYPLKWIGKKLDFINYRGVIVFFAIAYPIGLIMLYYERFIPREITQILPIPLSLLGFTMVLKSFTERKNIYLGWFVIIMNHFWIVLGISFNEHFKTEHSLIYLSGIVVSAVVGYLCLRRLKKLERGFNLNRFHGHSYLHPKIALVFLIACLGVSGFPITPTFIGEDLIFSHVGDHQAILAIILSLCFITNGLSIIRMYARIFLGPNVKSVYDMAYRSS